MKKQKKKKKEKKAVINKIEINEVLSLIKWSTVIKTTFVSFVGRPPKDIQQWINHSSKSITKEAEYIA